MDTIRCRKCGIDNASNTTNCRHCGASIQRFALPTIPKALLRYLFVALVILGPIWVITSYKPAEPTASGIAKPLNSVEQFQQQERKALIDELIKQGIFQKVQKAGNHATAWTTPLFDLLTFDDKQKAIGIVYAYHITANPQSDIVLLRSNITGKDIGQYAAAYGGLKLE